MSDLFTSQEQTKAYFVTRDNKDKIRCVNTYYSNTNNIYYIHNHKYNTSILQVINNEISITDYFKDRKTEFFKHNPQQLNMVFTLIIEKINNQFKMNL